MSQARKPDAIERVLLPALAESGKQARQIAFAICRLVTKGAELGEMEQRPIMLDAAPGDGRPLGPDGKPRQLLPREWSLGPDGNPRMVRALPRDWLLRLASAVRGGAFERMTVDQIVERILTPLPESTSRQ